MQIPAWKVTNGNVNASSSSSSSEQDVLRHDPQRWEGERGSDSFGPGNHHAGDTMMLARNESSSTGIKDYYGYTNPNNTVVKVIFFPPRFFSIFSTSGGI